MSIQQYFSFLFFFSPLHYTCCQRFACGRSNNLPLQSAVTALAAETEDKPVVVKPGQISKCFIEGYHQGSHCFTSCKGSVPTCPTTSTNPVHALAYTNVHSVASSSQEPMEFQDLGSQWGDAFVVCLPARPACFLFFFPS